MRTCRDRGAQRQGSSAGGGQCDLESLRRLPSSESSPHATDDDGIRRLPPSSGGLGQVGLREQGCQVAARTYRAWRSQRPAARTFSDALVVEAIREVARTTTTNVQGQRSHGFELAWTLAGNVSRRLARHVLRGHRAAKPEGCETWDGSHENVCHLGVARVGVERIDSVPHSAQIVVCVRYAPWATGLV